MQEPKVFYCLLTTVISRWLALWINSRAKKFLPAIDETTSRLVQNIVDDDSSSNFCIMTSKKAAATTVTTKNFACPIQIYHNFRPPPQYFNSYREKIFQAEFLWAVWGSPPRPSWIEISNFLPRYKIIIFLRRSPTIDENNFLKIENSVDMDEWARFVAAFDAMEVHFSLNS